MDWNSILIAGAVVVVVPLVGRLWGLLLPRKSVRAWGVRVGKAMSAFGQKKVGTHWESNETRFQSTLADFIGGVNDGLDYDDTGV